MAHMDKERKDRRERRSFTPEFKAGAVALVIDQGKTIAEVSRDLDVRGKPQEPLHRDRVHAEDVRPPGGRFDVPWDVLRLRDGEWVHAGRGVTLFVNPDTRQVLRWAVYVPCSVTEYVVRLRPQLATQELPTER